MKYQMFASALKAVSSALSSAFKMSASQRFALEKARAISEVNALKASLGSSQEDATMAGILEECVVILDRLEYMTYEER